VRAKAMELRSPGDEEARRFLEEYFTPWRLANPDGAIEGLVTVTTNRSCAAAAPWPRRLFTLCTVRRMISSLSTFPRPTRSCAACACAARRGESVSCRITRARKSLAVPHRSPERKSCGSMIRSKPFSSRSRVPEGSSSKAARRLRLGYADQNGHPFQSIGRYLVERGELQLGEASMSGIKAGWRPIRSVSKSCSTRTRASCSFANCRSPTRRASVGALGVPLAPGRSIAVDPRYVPLGAPVFLATTFPASASPLTRLVLAQDTGGAIRNPVRADFFWGFGPEAGAQAGRMRQPGRMWALLPKDLKPAPTGAVTP